MTSRSGTATPTPWLGHIDAVSGARALTSCFVRLIGMPA